MYYLYLLFLYKEGRKNFTKADKIELCKTHSNRCFFCRGVFAGNELQIDHKIPYELAGNTEYEKFGRDALIPLCASCNRSKSWGCEGCDNFIIKEHKNCETCYWVNPDTYEHIAMRESLHLNVVFEKGELGYDFFSQLSHEAKKKQLQKLLDRD